MKPEVLAQVDRLRAGGWVVRSASPRRPVPAEVMARYPWMPQVFRDFAEEMEVILNAGDTAWFLTANDFSGRTDIAFAWNEWEKQSYVAAAGDSAWADEIRRFWDEHLPVFMSLTSGYAFCGIKKTTGAVVCGEEPEWEEVTDVAPSFEAFLDLVAQGDPSVARLL